jgi:hypothetical protein
MTAEECSWPAELDALVCAAQYHALLFENDHVRVLEARVPAGHTVPLHTHRWPGVQYIITWSDFIRRDADGRILLDSRELGTNPEGHALWSDPLAPHTLENVGDRELRVIAVEQKNC